MQATLNRDALARHTQALGRLFAATADKYAAHEKARPLLAEMAADREFLTAALARHLAEPGALARRHYPVVTVRVALTPHHSIEMNCWVPLPDGRTDLSTKAIHHHGDLLLTTVTAFGPGYEHWTFHRPEPVDAAPGLYRLRLLEAARHGTGHIAFVDSFFPHVPLFPAALSITLALWSSKKPTTWRDHLKRVPLLKRNEKLLRAAARRLGLVRALDIKVVRDFDFYPTGRGFQVMRDRTEFPLGPNEDYLHSLFHILQETGNEALAPVVREAVAREPGEEVRRTAERLLGMLDAGRPIAPRLSPGHYDVPFANFTADDIRRALAAQEAAPCAAGPA